MTGTVYRPAARDEHGDPVDSDGHTVRLSGDGTAKLGQISGLIIGGPSGSTRSAADLGLRGDVIATDGMLGYPADNEIHLQAGDVVGGATRATGRNRTAVSVPPIVAIPATRPSAGVLVIRSSSRSRRPATSQHSLGDPQVDRDEVGLANSSGVAIRVSWRRDCSASTNAGRWRSML